MLPPRALSSDGSYVANMWTKSTNLVVAVIGSICPKTRLTADRRNVVIGAQYHSFLRNVHGCCIFVEIVFVDEAAAYQ
ncbi:hypothetical protein M378DRAFT_539971 [Amanita muscaria Koide BX008]|uniref:Uncharacterized protein n=1 Tax=Amanita muscaria (strain Koide BX008) TaxID=946122 RepID=A0A0C2S0I4_AMAMK|nr:hypothetical protein M378DRAFT_539971 [Amanita muscaria Koide BX008]